MRTRIMAVIVIICAVAASIAVAHGSSRTQQQARASHTSATRVEDMRGRAVRAAVVHGAQLRRHHRRAIHAHRARVVAKQRAEAAAQRQAVPNAQTTQVSTPVQGSASSGGGGSGLQAIAQCESGGNPAAVSPDGQYRGKYQFDYGTWASVGGRGDPAAAPESEQDRRAAMLHQRSGNAPWPVCGH